MTSFGARLRDAVARSGRLCVGIDPHPYLLAAWGLDDSAQGLREFSLRVVDATLPRVAVVKPQVAFYERHGSTGIAALEETIATARAGGLLVIADAKRGDVGSSVEAYGQAWLTPGLPLESDAMTVSAFQGFGSLADVVRLAAAHDKGLFVLSATSNPEAAVIQQATTAHGRRVAAEIAEAVISANANANASAGGDAWGSLGLVLGATLDLAEYGIDIRRLSGTPILAPGFGHQGARVADRDRIFGAAAGSVLVSASRSILAAGPRDIAAAIDRHVTEIVEGA